MGVFPAGYRIHLGMVVPELFMPMPEGWKVEDGEISGFCFSYVKKLLGQGMPDTLEVGA